MNDAPNKSARRGPAPGRRRTPRAPAGYPALLSTPSHSLGVEETVAEDTGLILATIRTATHCGTVGWREADRPRPLHMHGAPDGSEVIADLVKHRMSDDDPRMIGWFLEIARHLRDEPPRTIRMRCQPDLPLTLAGAMHFAERMHEAALDALESARRAAARAATAGDGSRPETPRPAHLEAYARILGDVASITEVDPSCGLPHEVHIVLAALDPMDSGFDGRRASRRTSDGNGSPTEGPDGVAAGHIDVIHGGFANIPGMIAAVAGTAAPDRARIVYDPDTTRLLLDAMPEGWTITTRNNTDGRTVHEAGPYLCTKRIGWRPDGTDDIDGVETLRIMQRLGITHTPRIAAEGT